MQSGELYDSGVAKHTLFEVTDIRKVMKGDFFRYGPRGVYDVVSARLNGAIRCFSGRRCFFSTAAWRNTVFFGAVVRPDVERPDRVIFGAAERRDTAFFSMVAW